MKRFWDKVNVQGPDDCWEWQSPSKSNSGYGIVRVKGKTVGANRRAYQLRYGEIPEGMVVRHKCDNKLCCNPHHLEVGTQKDNIHDSIKRDLHGTCRLTTQQVAEIRKKLAEVVKPYGANARLAKEYGVNVTTIERIKYGKTWAYQEA